MTAVALLAVVVAQIGAQSRDTSKVWSAFTRPAIDSASTQPNQRAVAAEERKSPGLAGTLSFLILPGLGSYYAGNSTHGTIHAAIAVASGVGFVAAGAGTCQRSSGGNITYHNGVPTYSEDPGKCDNNGQVAGAAAALGVYLINDVWSIFTAVGDARARNDEGPGRVAGSLYFEPAARHAGLQLFSWHF